MHPGKQRDLEAAAGKGIEAVHLGENQASALNVERLGDLIRQLTPHAQVAAMQEGSPIKGVPAPIQVGQLSGRADELLTQRLQQATPLH